VTDTASAEGVTADCIEPCADEVSQVLEPDDYPSRATCNAFDKAQVLRAW
jgi:hypothetical protein